MENNTLQLRKKVIEAAEKAENNEMLKAALKMLSGDSFVLPPNEASAVAEGLADIKAGRTHTSEETEAYFESKIQKWQNEE